MITIFNLNRPVRVKLLGVDAPEMNQSFGDVARKHLSDLVYNKSVVVHYSGIAADNSLRGRVLLDNADIGAQMIRDGAAWFDPNNQNRLSATELEIYQQSEQAARSERRGLWQVENPMAPWEFVKAEALRRNPVATQNAILPAARARANRPIPELTSLSLLTARTSAEPPRQATSGESDMSAAWASLSSTRKNWHQLQPAGHNFSALVPDEGKEIVKSVSSGDQSMDVNVYLARDGGVLISLMWFVGRSEGETDKDAIDAMVIDGLLKGLRDGYQGGGSAFSCERQRERDVSSNGYKGSEFDLTSCSIPTRVRTFTRVVGNQRELYLGAVFYTEENENVGRFLNSFTVGRKTKPASNKAKIAAQN